LAITTDFCEDYLYIIIKLYCFLVEDHSLCNNVYNMEQKQKTNGRTKVMLETWPAHRLADVFVASFEVSFEEHLSMLDAVDLRLRLSKATEIVTRHLQVLSSLFYQIEKTSSQ
jgi:hypothetical protein